MLDHHGDNVIYDNVIGHKDNVMNHEDNVLGHKDNVTGQ